MLPDLIDSLFNNNNLVGKNKLTKRKINLLLLL
jgi:hypothetical protein